MAADPTSASAASDRARLEATEQALTGLHHRLLDAERELDDARRQLAASEAARDAVERELAAVLATRTVRALRLPRAAYARLRRRGR